MVLTISSCGGVDVVVVVLVVDGGDASFSICLKFSREINREKKVKGLFFLFLFLIFLWERLS